MLYREIIYTLLESLGFALAFALAVGFWGRILLKICRVKSFLAYGDILPVCAFFGILCVVLRQLYYVTMAFDKVYLTLFLLGILGAVGEFLLKLKQYQTKSPTKAEIFSDLKKNYGKLFIFLGFALVISLYFSLIWPSGKMESWLSKNHDYYDMAFIGEYWRGFLDLERFNVQSPFKFTTDSFGSRVIFAFLASARSEMILTTIPYFVVIFLSLVGVALYNLTQMLFKFHQVLAFLIALGVITGNFINFMVFYGFFPQIIGIFAFLSGLAIIIQKKPDAEVSRLNLPLFFPLLFLYACYLPLLIVILSVFLLASFIFSFAKESNTLLHSRIFSGVITSLSGIFKPFLICIVLIPQTFYYLFDRIGEIVVQDSVGGITMIDPMVLSGIPLVNDTLYKFHSEATYFTYFVYLALLLILFYGVIQIDKLKKDKSKRDTIKIEKLKKGRSNTIIYDLEPTIFTSEKEVINIQTVGKFSQAEGHSGYAIPNESEDFNYSFKPDDKSTFTPPINSTVNSTGSTFENIWENNGENIKSKKSHRENLKVRRSFQKLRIFTLFFIFIVSIVVYLLAYKLFGDIYQVWKFSGSIILPLTFLVTGLLFANLRNLLKHKAKPFLFVSSLTIILLLLFQTIFVLSPFYNNNRLNRFRSLSPIIYTFNLAAKTYQKNREILGHKDPKIVIDLLESIRSLAAACVSVYYPFKFYLVNSKSSIRPHPDYISTLDTDTVIFSDVYYTGLIYGYPAKTTSNFTIFQYDYATIQKMGAIAYYPLDATKKAPLENVLKIKILVPLSLRNKNLTFRVTIVSQNDTQACKPISLKSQEGETLFLNNGEPDPNQPLKRTFEANLPPGLLDSSILNLNLELPGSFAGSQNPDQLHCGFWIYGADLLQARSAL
ncbi:MAG: hypothetical protein LBF22_09040 [Deltaproteobacteria bacterium]|nr:hypothetical protein [Deltaproteobacteria bacterium]